MDGVRTSYEQNADRFGAVVDRATPDAWGGKSPCDEWTAGEVVAHVVDTQRDFLVKQGLDVGPTAESDPGTLWRTHQDAVRTAIADDGVLGQEYDGYFGRTTIGETLANFYGFDMIVHRWDLGSALGQEVRFTEEEMDRLEASIAGFGETLYSPGVCKPALPVPEDAPRQERLLGLMGRGV